MEKSYDIGGHEFLVSKTSQEPYINGRPHIRLQVRKEIIRDGRTNGYHLMHFDVPKRSTWAEIEELVERRFGYRSDI